MKYLKLFESVEGLSHIDDLFADLKEISNVTSWTAGKNDEILTFCIRVPEFPIVNINGSPHVEYGKQINVTDIDDLYKYPTLLKRVFDNVKKVINLCNCKYTIGSNSGSNTIMIQFYN